MDWILSLWDGTDLAFTLDGWGAMIGGFLRASLLWLIELWHDWTSVFYHDWFEYCFSLIDMTGIPLLSSFKPYVLCLNAWIPVDLGLKFFAAYVQIVIAIAAFRTVKSVLGW